MAEVKIMKSGNRAANGGSFLFLALILLLAGCATVPQPGSGPVGTLRTSGPHVFVNGRPATGGTAVYFGDEVATGAGSSAIVDFRQGGFLQLDENTDPLISYWEQARCILIRVFGGQISVKGSGICVEAPPLRFALNSEANLQVAPGSFVLTILQGSATLSWPARRLLTRAQQVRLSPQGMEGRVRTLSEQDLRAVVQWREKFRFPTRRDPGLSPGPGDRSPSRIAPPRSQPAARDRRPGTPSPGTSSPPVSDPAVTSPPKTDARKPLDIRTPPKDLRILEGAPVRPADPLR